MGELARSQSRNVFMHGYLFFELFFFFLSTFMCPMPLLLLGDDVCFDWNWNLPDFCLQSKLFISSITPPPKKKGQGETAVSVPAVHF